MIIRILLIIAMIFFSIFGFGQNSEKEYFGIINDEEIRLIIGKEALEMDGKINILKIEPKQIKTDTINSNSKPVENFDILQFKVKRFYEIGEKIEFLNVEVESFIQYYNSLSNEYKTDLLFTSQISYKPIYFVKNSREIQEFILKKYDETPAKRIHQVKSYKTNFLSLIGAKNFLQEIDGFLSEFSNNDYHYHNDKFILLLLQNGDELKAIHHFENLVGKKITEYQNQEIREPKHSIISLSNYTLDCELLFNPKTQFRYIETCISAIESNAFNLGEVINNIQLLWRSNLLNEQQKKRLLEYSKIGVKNHFGYSKANISQLQSCFNNIIADYYGFNYLLNYRELGHFDNKYNFPAFEIERIVRYKKLNSEQKTYILNFLKENYSEEKIDWKYFGGKQWIMTHLADFSLMDNQVIYNESEIRDFLNSKSLLDTNGNKGLEKALVRDAYRIDIVRPLPLNKYVWDLIGNRIPEVWFDMEAGTLPVDYSSILNLFSKAMKEKLGLAIALNQNNVKNNNVISYNLSFNSFGSNKEYRVEFSNSSDWYSMNSIINVLNLICIDNNKSERWISLDTGDQTASFILVTPEILNELNIKYNLKDKYK